MATIPAVTKIIHVPMPVDAAFELFTVGVDRWWPKFASIGSSPIVESVFEPEVGGRWFSRHEDGSKAVRGHVKVWQPSGHFKFSWEVNADFQPDPREEVASAVDVRFTREPDGRTRVELAHSDFDRMGDAEGRIVHDRVETGWDRMLGFYVQVAKGSDGAAE